MSKKEYYIAVHRIYTIYVEAENEAEALDIAYENAEAVNNGIADDYYGEIIEVKEI